MNNIRLRFPPSPTGKFHIGSARTALFSYLYARKMGGTFVLRLEDTDQSRSTKEFEENIMEGMEWLGLNWDEGPIPGTNKYKGDFAPYRQIERFREGLYQPYIDKLFKEDRAYYCYCTPEELEEEKKAQAEKKEAPKYTGKCRECSKEKIEQYEKEGRSKVVRLRLNPEIIKYKDIIKGDIEFDMALYGDPVIVRSDGMPLYNFVVVVDDLTMKITHVIRGEDHISNTPIQIAIYKALGAGVPEFGHLPLTLTPDKKKMSKRFGDISIDKYKKEGYLKEALINFAALLGWSSGTEQEIYSKEELEKVFSLARVQKSNAIFDVERLNWLNGVWIRKLSLDRITAECIPYLKEAKLINDDFDRIYVEKVISLVKERLKILSEVIDLTAYFFKDLVLNPEKLVFRKSTIETTKQGLEDVIILFEDTPMSKWPLNVDEMNNLMNEAKNMHNLSNGDVFWPVRYALSFSEASPSPAELLTVLPKEVSLKRLKAALKSLS